MKALKIILGVFGLVIVFLGLVFLIGGKPVYGAVILITGVALIVFALRKPKTRDVIIKQELELTGDVSIENMKCSQCAATLSSENVKFKAGTVFVSCPFCGSEYQIEEAPKW